MNQNSTVYHLVYNNMNLKKFNDFFLNIKIQCKERWLNICYGSWWTIDPKSCMKNTEEIENLFH